MIIYPLQLGHPLVSRQEYLTQQQKCSLLADVGSQMAKDWQEDGEPGNKNTEDFPDRFDDLWTWIPRSTCDVDEDTANTAKTIYGAQYKNFNIDYNNLIWNSFASVLGPKINRGPAAFIATENGHPHTAYLVFRGTLNGADIAIDLEATIVANPLGAGGTHQGFSRYFEGCGITSDPDGRPLGPVPSGPTLYKALTDLPAKGIKHLVVTGHSLGSAVGTLAAAFANTLADAEGAPIFETVRGSVSASPRVGDPLFKEWFKTLQDGKGNDLQHRFWRLRNDADGVPDLPSHEMGYIEVGYDVVFVADYPTSIKASLVTIKTPTQYEIVKKGLTNWHNMGFPADLEPENGAIFTPTAVGVVPPVFPKQEGEVKEPLWQANPNHNPCCCYAYAINHPQFTTNPTLNRGNSEYGGSCHFPVVAPRTHSGEN